MTDGGEFEFHPVQLATVFAQRASWKRWALSEDAPPLELDFTDPRVRGFEMLADGRGFRCDLTVSVTVPVDDREGFHADITMRGYFATTEPMTARMARGFARYQAVFLLWPFARAYLDVLATLAGVAAPPIPTLVVPRGR